MITAVKAKAKVVSSIDLPRAAQLAQTALFQLIQL